MFINSILSIRNRDMFINSILSKLSVHLLDKELKILKDMVENRCEILKKIEFCV
jgi:hypothetical protein